MKQVFEPAIYFIFILGLIDALGLSRRMLLKECCKLVIHCRDLDCRDLLKGGDVQVKRTSGHPQGILDSLVPPSGKLLFQETSLSLRKYTDLLNGITR